MKFCRNSGFVADLFFRETEVLLWCFCDQELKHSELGFGSFSRNFHLHFTSRNTCTHLDTSQKSLL